MVGSAKTDSSTSYSTDASRVAHQASHSCTTHKASKQPTSRAMELVTGAMGSLIPKLMNLLKDEYKLQTGVKDEVRCLALELESAHAALCKVAEVRRDQLDELVKIWAREVRESSYDMEDILDTYLVHVKGSHKPNEKESLLKSLGEKMTRLFKKSKERHKIAGAIEKIKKNLQEVSERHGRYTASSIVAKPAASSRTVDPRLTAMYREASQIIGIDKSSADLISMLSSKVDDNQNMKIVSVVGVGGLGKTTLAKAVYDKLKPLFGCGAFVAVGQEPDLKKVFRDILIHLDKEKYTDLKYTVWDEMQLIDEIRGFLGTKRYFVVIDDIWEPQSLEIIKSVLVANICESRVIITTRKFEVAKEADEVYKLGPLSNDNSKKLFYTRLFGGEDKCPNSHPHELSDTILKKCGGIPLAIIMMACLLLGKSRNEWFEVGNSPGFYQDKGDRHMKNTMYILSLSYYDLPSHLKICLLYLSVFPEDSLIYKDSLIWRWIGEGFVEKKLGHGLFEVGEEYFHDLINRSMIQGVVSTVDGIVDGCRVHDMVLDLIVSISSDENFVSVDGTLAQSKTRRLALRNRELDLSRDTDVIVPQVRSLLVLQCDIAHWAWHPRLKLIRVLVLAGCTFREGCESLRDIGNLLHLRYLGIRGIDVKKLPEGISRLKFLQTLELEDIGFLELPCSIGMLTQLVCLRAQDTSIPDGVIGRLTSLEELQIRLPRANNQSTRQFLKDLGNLCELKVLHIVWYGMHDNMLINLLQALDKLQKMQHLTLSCFCKIVHMNVWDAVVPSRDLRYLFHPHIMFPKLPSWINFVHLPSLSHLELSVECLDEQGLIALGGLPELCYLRLYINSAAILTSNNTEAEGCFQKLRSLVLHDSVVQFVPNQDSSASFAIYNIVKVVGWRRKKDVCKVAPAVIVMPNLEELTFRVPMNQDCNQNNIICEDIGLEYLPSLRRVEVDLWCYNAYEDVVEREEAALRHAIEVHPNRPALQIEYTGKDKIKRRSDNDDAAQPRNEEDEEETRVMIG